MAKAMRASGPSGDKNMGSALVAMVLMSLALYALVQGFALHLQAVQTGSQNYLTLLVWYFAGVLLMMVAKMVKHKAGWKE